MKYILVLVFLFSISYGDEIKRIELIIDDITELREQYKVCQEELNSKKNDEIYKNKIKKLQNQIKNYKKLLKSKDKKIKNLIITNNNKMKNTECKVNKFDKSNKFPKLILKSEYLKYKIIKIKPATYRLKTKTNIYNKINSKQIETWNEGVSFTTNVKAILKNEDSWFRITGFFIDGAWVKSQSQLWVKTKYAKKR